MTRPFGKLFVHLLIAVLASTGFTQPAQAALISTEQAVAAGAAQQARAKIAGALERPEMQAEFERRGVSRADAQARIAALSDTEVAALAQQIDALPAGGDGLVEALLFIFVLLLVTDIIGLTKVFPFTRSAHR